MMKEEVYILKEAFKKGYLQPKDKVNIERILKGRYRKYALLKTLNNRYRMINLNEFYNDEDFNKGEEILKRDETVYFCCSKWKELHRIYVQPFIKLLEDDGNIKVTCEVLNENNDVLECIFVFILNPNSIIVRFEGEEETAFLEFPHHEAYTY